MATRRDSEVLLEMGKKAKTTDPKDGGIGWLLEYMLELSPSALLMLRDVSAVKEKTILTCLVADILLYLRENYNLEKKSVEESLPG